MKNHSTLLHFETAKGHPALRTKEILESETEMAQVLPVPCCPLPFTPLSQNKNIWKVHSSWSWRILGIQVQKKSRLAACAPAVTTKLKEQCFLQIWGYQLETEWAVNCWNSIYFDGSCLA